MPQTGSNTVITGCLQGCQPQRMRTWHRGRPCCWRRRCAKQAAGSQVLATGLHAVISQRELNTAAQRASGRRRSGSLIARCQRSLLHPEDGALLINARGLCTTQAAARRRAGAAAAPWSSQQTWAASRCWTGRPHRRVLMTLCSYCMRLAEQAVSLEMYCHVLWNFLFAGQRAGSQERAALATAQPRGLGRPPGSRR